MWWDWLKNENLLLTFMNKPDPSLRCRESHNTCGTEQEVAAFSKIYHAPPTYPTLFKHITETNPLDTSTHTNKSVQSRKNCHWSSPSIMPASLLVWANILILVGRWKILWDEKKSILKNKKCIYKHFSLINKFEFGCFKIKCFHVCQPQPSHLHQWLARHFNIDIIQQKRKIKMKSEKGKFNQIPNSMISYYQ